jgi:hypothetical protein
MAKHLKANGREDRIENNWEVLMVHQRSSIVPTDLHDWVTAIVIAPVLLGFDEEESDCAESAIMIPDPARSIPLHYAVLRHLEPHHKCLGVPKDRTKHKEMAIQVTLQLNETEKFGSKFTPRDIVCFRSRSENSVSSIMAPCKKSNNTSRNCCIISRAPPRSSPMKSGPRILLAVSVAVLA